MKIEKGFGLQRSAALLNPSKRPRSLGRSRSWRNPWGFNTPAFHAIPLALFPKFLPAFFALSFFPVLAIFILRFLPALLMFNFLQPYASGYRALPELLVCDERKRIRCCGCIRQPSPASCETYRRMGMGEDKGWGGREGRACKLAGRDESLWNIIA